MVSITIAVAFHPLWLWIFLIKWDMGIVGVALAGTVSNTIDFILIKAIMACQSELKPTRIWICDPSTFQREVLKEYATVAYPFIFISFLNNWSLQQMVIASGYLPLNDQAI